MGWAAHVVPCGREEVYTVFWWGKRGERDNLEHRRRWEDNIKIDLQEVKWGVVFIYLAQDRDRYRTLLN
jgi:hypothetical protein